MWVGSAAAAAVPLRRWMTMHILRTMTGLAIP